MDARLILWGWFTPQLVQNKLIPDIEKNCMRYGIPSLTAYEIFQKSKAAPNSLFFLHSYADSDIPMGQEYQKIAVRENFEIQPASIQICHSKVLCFFTAVRMQPSECALRGYHELSLVQFKDGIPQMLYDELPEITELPFDNRNKKEICLFI